MNGGIDMAYELIKKHTTRNYTNKTTKKNYIVLHYTGNKTDTAKANANHFHTTYRGVSAHYFVDDTTVYEVVDPDKVAWAVGKNYGKNNLFNTVKNTNSIQIEMCSKNGRITDATYANAVALTKKLMKTYGITADHVYRHYDVCSKLCPGWTGWTGKDTSIWQRFKKDIAGTSSSTTAVGYKVKITCDTLNVRDGAGTTYKVKMQVHKDEVYTIVAESGGWGKLKSGAGWISLKYTKKV